jgi:hypothetical protein
MKIDAFHPAILIATHLTVSSARLTAQVDYEGDQLWSQRADSGPDAEVPGWFYNLAIAGKALP